MNPEHLGYALTVVCPLGVTIDRTFGIGGGSLFQKAGYTHLTHSRRSNSLYVIAPENPRQEVGRNAEARNSETTSVPRRRHVSNPGAAHRPGPPAVMASPVRSSRPTNWSTTLHQAM